MLESVGINLGKSLSCCNDNPIIASDTGWGNPARCPSLVSFIKDSKNDLHSIFPQRKVTRRPKSGNASLSTMKFLSEAIMPVFISREGALSPFHLLRQCNDRS